MRKLTPILLPGTMCDGRLWGGGDGILDVTLQIRTGGDPADADLSKATSIAAMAQHALTTADGLLLPIGFSMGAIVGMEMWRQAPDRIAGLALAGYNATADLPERAAHRPVQQAEVRGGGLERVLVEDLKPNYLGAAHRGDIHLLALLRDMGMSLGNDVFLRQSEALRLRPSQTGLLPTLTVPVLYLCGAEDALCPPAWHREWAALTPGSQFIEIPEAGHMLPLEEPYEFTAAIGDWMYDNWGSLHQ